MYVKASNGEEYKVIFRYLIEGWQRNTACEIFLAGSNPRLEGMGLAWLHPLDANRFCRETGRKIALSRALKDVFPGDKNVRREFWETYFQRDVPRKPVEAEVAA